MPMGSAPWSEGERTVDVCRHLGGPILPRVDFEIQEGAIEKAVGWVNAVWKD